MVAMVRAGGAEAFGCVVEEYEQPILRYLYRLTGNIVAAQDLTQDTFIQAYKGIAKTKPELNLKAWLYKIATNNARQLMRRGRLFRFIPFDDHRETKELAVEDQTEQVGENLAIRDALRKVPLEQRECLVLHFVEGFRYKEIGQALGISEDAVRMRIARGKQSFPGSYQGGGNDEL